MKQFAEIDPYTVMNHPGLVATIVENVDTRNSYYFLIIDEYLIIYGITNYEDPNTFEKELLHYQIEFPKQGLVWFLDSMQHRFFKTEAEGGLPKGVFHDITTINGERIAINRAFNADGNRGGGYAFATLDRKEDGYFAKEYLFTDEFLFNGGLIEILQDIAGKIQRGEL